GTRIATTRMTAPCQRNSTSATPVAWTNGPLARTLLIEQLPDFAKVFRRSLAARQRLNDELRSRPAERAIDQVEHQASQCLLLAIARAIQMEAAVVLAQRQALAQHDLQCLEGGRVPDGSPAGQRVVDFADGAGAAVPQHPQNGELGVGWLTGFGHDTIVSTMTI